MGEKWVNYMTDQYTDNGKNGVKIPKNGLLYFEKEMIQTNGTVGSVGNQRLPPENV